MWSMARVACSHRILPSATGQRRSGLRFRSRKHLWSFPYPMARRPFPRLPDSSATVVVSLFALWGSAPVLIDSVRFASAARRSDGFSEQESALLSLVSHYAALAIEERFNFAQSELVRAQLEEERTKLKLVLDLNNSVVSNLELKEILQAISPGMRKAMRLDGVALILPDGEGRPAATLRPGFPGRKWAHPAGSAAFAQRVHLRSSISHSKTLERTYRAIAEGGPGLQNRVHGRG